MCIIWKRHDNVTHVSSSNLSARIFRFHPRAIARYVITVKISIRCISLFSVCNAEIFRIEITHLQKNSVAYLYFRVGAAQLTVQRQWSAAAYMDWTFESSHEILFFRIKISCCNNSLGYSLKSTWRSCVENNRNYTAIILAHGAMRIIGSWLRFTKAVNVIPIRSKI